MDTPYASAFQAAQEIIVKGSAIAMQFFHSGFTSRLKADNSVVTEADVAVESFIRTALEEQFPDFGFVGEEGRENKKEVSWIVDPIDGTAAFARGIPEFSHVIALLEGTQVMFSLIYYPTASELFTAKRGEGAYKNDTRIMVSQVSDLGQGFASINGRHFRDEATRDHAHRFSDAFRTRIGYAGVESCLLAQGSIEVLVKFHQHIWDVAPEMLLITEAGGIFTDEYGDPITFTSLAKDLTYNYIATTPLIRENYSDILYFKRE